MVINTSLEEAGEFTLYMRKKVVMSKKVDIYIYTQIFTPKLSFIFYFPSSTYNLHTFKIFLIMKTKINLSRAGGSRDKKRRWGTVYWTQNFIQKMRKDNAFGN